MFLVDGAIIAGDVGTWQIVQYSVARTPAAPSTEKRSLLSVLQGGDCTAPDVTCPREIQPIQHAYYFEHVSEGRTRFCSSVECCQQIGNAVYVYFLHMIKVSVD